MYIVHLLHTHIVFLLINAKCEFMDLFSQIFLTSFAAKSVICAVEQYKLPVQKDKYTSYLVWPVDFP